MIVHKTGTLPARIAGAFCLMAFICAHPFAAGAGGREVPQAAPSPEPTPATASLVEPLPRILIDAGRRLNAVNPLVLGNNVQWTDDADALWDPDRRDFNPVILEPVRRLKTPVLRFPGGTHSDFYRWKDAVGPPDRRKPGIHAFSKKSQPSHFGTDEFLALCQKLNAEPLMTANVVTGTAEEAAEWVAYCNRTLPAKYWEIGNEPYLAPQGQPLDPGYPEIFAQKFKSFAQAMKAAKPDIRVGLPLRSDLVGRYPGGPYPKFDRRVLAGCGLDADFVALHNAYFPAIFQPSEDRYPDAYLALMAAPLTVREDLEKVRREIREAVPSKNLPIAVTEYNAFFSMPGLSAAAGTATQGAALYTALLLMDWLGDPGILMANFWSLSGNWYFGAVRQDGRLRPQYQVLRLFSEHAGRFVIDSSVEGGPVFDSPAAGYLPARKNVPVLDVWATRTGSEGTVRDQISLFVVNKSLGRDIDARIEVLGAKLSETGSVWALTAPSIRSDNEATPSTSLAAQDLHTTRLQNYRFPKHSLTVIRLDVAVGSAESALNRHKKPAEHSGSAGFNERRPKARSLFSCGRRPLRGPADRRLRPRQDG